MLFSIAYSIGYYAAKCEEERRRKISNGDSAKSPEGNLSDSLVYSLVEIGGEEITLEEFCSSELLESTNGSKPNSSEDKFQAATLSLTIKSEENGSSTQATVLTLKFPADFDVTNKKALEKIISKINSVTSIEKHLGEKKGSVKETKTNDHIANERENELHDKNRCPLALDEQEQQTSETTGKALIAYPFYESDVLKTLLGGTGSVMLYTARAKASKFMTEDTKPKPETRAHGNVPSNMPGKLLKTDSEYSSQLPKNESATSGLLPTNEPTSLATTTKKEETIPIDVTAGNASSTAQSCTEVFGLLPMNEPTTSITTPERIENDNNDEDILNDVPAENAASKAKKCSETAVKLPESEPASLTTAPENKSDQTSLQKLESHDKEYHRCSHAENEPDLSATTPERHETIPHDVYAGNAVSTAPKCSESSGLLPKKETDTSRNAPERAEYNNNKEENPIDESARKAASTDDKCSETPGLPPKNEPESSTTAPDRNEDILDESSLQKPEPRNYEYHRCTEKRLKDGWLIFGKEECLTCGCSLMIAPNPGSKKGVCVNESCKLGGKSGRASPTPTCGTQVETWNETEAELNAETFSNSDFEFGMQHGDPKIALDEIEQGSGRLVETKCLLSRPPKPDGRHLKDNSNNFRQSCPKGNHENSIVCDNAESQTDKCGAKEKVNPVIAPRPQRPTPPAPDQRTGPKRIVNEQAKNGKLMQTIPAKSKQPPKPGDFASEPCPDSRSVYSRTSKKQQRPSPDCNTIYSHAPKEVSQPILDSKSVYSRSSRRHKQPRPEDCKSVCTRKTNKGGKSRPDGGNNDKHLHSSQDDVDCKGSEKIKSENRQPDACKSACTRRPSPDCCLTACSGRRSRYGPPSVVVRMPNSRMDDDEDSASELSDHAETVVSDTFSAVVKRMNAVTTKFKDSNGLASKTDPKRSELTELIKTLSSAAEAVRKLEQLQLLASDENHQ